jgi:inner membrane protein involved in colicin E2 resistance
VTRVGPAEYDSDDDRFPLALTVLAILGGVVLVVIPLVLIGTLIDRVSP